MKTKSTRKLQPAALAAILLGVSPALVAEPNAPRGSARDDHTAPSRQTDTLSRDQSHMAGRSGIRAAADNPHGRKAGELLGTDVYGNDDQKLGDLRDLLVDPRSGKITHAVVASGGILGFGANLRPVPIEACRQGEDRLAIGLDETRWEQAPVFTRDQLRSLNEGTRMQEISSFYGDETARPPQAEDRRTPAQLVLASDIRGKDVRQDDRKIGEIDDLIVRFESRTVSALFDAEDSFVDADHDFVVPLAQFQNFGRDDGLTTRLSGADFAAASPTASVRASTGSDHSYAGAGGLYIWPETAPTATGMSGPAVYDVRRDDRAQADARASRAPVEEIRRAVQTEAPQVRREVRVEVEENKVVLRGTVPDENTKERIENRAEDAARGWDVESELRVAGTATR